MVAVIEQQMSFGWNPFKIESTYSVLALGLELRSIEHADEDDMV